ncbi:MAG: electron transfer flavoprotein subunit alpha/FixB family protein [Myxococcales bacterium]|nr:electron transfer flavoprotein subunit alpha/FixB family protein [Myxococcales bacterium]MCB9707960.1 electron transfer flavoprotein subunit alpha/FixB family protein [Myxococcales bacterium]
MNVLVVAELLDGKLRNNTLSAIQAAKMVCEIVHGSFDIFAIGEGAEHAAKELVAYGANKVWVKDVEGGYVAEHYAPHVAALAEDQGHRVLMATATGYGKDLMPRVAAKLGGAMVSDISAVAQDGPQIRYVRPIYAGNVFATLEVKAPIHVITVRQAEFPFADTVNALSPLAPWMGQIEPSQEKVRFLELRIVQSARPELAEARIVVSGGRGLKSAENFKTVLEPLVDVLGAAMGASRAACDAGYVPGELQVGQTGKVVAPDLYIAVGISGAIQHVAGIKGAKVIVAINKDKDAPIAQLADYMWVTDLFTAVPELTEAIRGMNPA